MDYKRVNVCASATHCMIALTLSEAPPTTMCCNGCACHVSIPCVGVRGRHKSWTRNREKGCCCLL